MGISHPFFSIISIPGSESYQGAPSNRIPGKSLQVGQRVGFLQVRRSRGRILLQADVIVNGIPETLLVPQLSFCCVDGDVTQKKLDLLQFAAGLMAQWRTGPS